MNKYQEALEWLMEGNDPFSTEWDLLEELVDRATPKKPKIVKLFCLDITTCAGLGCGAGITKEESMFHKSKYCGECGQAIDWSGEDEKAT